MDFDFSSTTPAEGAQLGNFQILQALTEARNEHGMRQNEYDRYRAYCTKKVHRLRQLAKITHVDEQHAPGKQKKKVVAKRGKRPTPAQQAEAASKLGGNEFKRQNVVTQDIKDQTIPSLLLFEAERNWAHSQELKAAAFDKDNDSRLFKQGAARARRAVQWAAHLVAALNALSSLATPRLRLEAATYLCVIRASASFDRSRSSESLQQSCVARKLLGFLASHSANAKDEAFANSFIDAGDAQIRFSAYQLELGEQNLDVIEQGVADEETCEKWAPGCNALMKELTAASRTGGASQERADNTLSWHGKTISIRNPELVEAIAHAEKERTALEEALQLSAKDGERKKKKSKSAAEAENTTRLKHSERNAKRREGGTRRFKGTSSKTSMDPFDRALSATADAETLAGELVEDNTAALAKSHSSRYQAVNNELKMVHEYLSYFSLSLRIRRNNYLAKEVQRKAEKRERRAREATEARISGAKQRSSPASEKTKKRTQEASKKKSSYKPRKLQRKAKKLPRRPARGGSKRLRARQIEARSRQLRAIEEEKSKRRQARAVPALAKLLDSAEASLNSVAGLTLVEGEPDVSSLVDAKIAWYRAELLRQLARAYSLSRAYSHSVLLTQRAQLFIRQARSALELASNVEKENVDMPPLTTEQTLDESDKLLAESLRSTQKAAALDMLEKRTDSLLPRLSSTKAEALGDSTAALALREIASKYVEFDSASLEVASRIPTDVLREVQKGPASKPTVHAVSAMPKAPAEEEAEAEEEADAFQEADEGEAGSDEEFEDADDAEEDVQGGETEAKKGWFGGWLGRK